jgi:dTDP-4-dehydrorhamnose 3,5-epimerase-like enzyme
VFNLTDLSNLHVTQIPKIPDPRGNLTFIEGGRHVPFEIARVYFVYDVPVGSARGGHAHRETSELVVAVSGSFDVTLDTGEQRRTYSLNRPYEGLTLPTMVWRELTNFSSGAVALVFASTLFSETDYIRDYSDFLREKGSN